MSSIGFDAWLASLDGELYVDERTEPGPWALAWLGELFVHEGAVSSARVADAWEEMVVLNAERSIAQVLDDYTRTTGQVPPRVEVSVSPETGFKITWRGSYTTPSISPSMTEATPERVVVETADYLQEHITDDLWSAWPVCVEHAVGLHAEVHDEVPVWRCRRGDHAVAPIGRLTIDVTK